MSADTKINFQTIRASRTRSGGPVHISMLVSKIKQAMETKKNNSEAKEEAGTLIQEIKMACCERSKNAMLIRLAYLLTKIVENKNVRDKTEQQARS